MLGDAAPVTVVGPGRMGVGIALAFALGGSPVDLVDLKAREEPMSALERARAQFDEQLDLLISFSVLEPDERETLRRRLQLRPTGPEANEALGRATVVIEAVPERLEAKREAFERICAATPADALIASTTSSFLADALAELVTHPARFLNMHWLNPAHLMPLVEVSPAACTAPDALAGTLALLRRVGKVPVTVAASPGYIIPRLQALVLNEAARMWNEGLASADDLDTATRLGFGLRFAVLGLLEFIDWGGVDTLLYASSYMSEELEAERFEPPGVVADLVADGATGMSAGRGVRAFSPIGAAELQRRRTGELVALLRHLELLPRPPVTTSISA